MKRQKSPKPLQPSVSAERLQMVEQFRRSGLTRKAFARQYRVPLATLSWWLSKTKHLPSSPTSPDPITFHEIKVIPRADLPETWAMEVESASGITVRCREALSAETLERLLRGPSC
jgi:hypothetical protein